MTIKGIVAAFEAFFTKVETFLAPFISTFASTEGQALLKIALGAVMAAASDPTLLTTADKRSAALKNMESEALSSGISAGETALLNALQAAYTQINPASAVVTAIVPTPQVVVAQTQ